MKCATPEIDEMLITEVDRELSGHRVIVKRHANLLDAWFVEVDGEAVQMTAVHYFGIGGVIVETDHGTFSCCGKRHYGECGTATTY